MERQVIFYCCHWPANEKGQKILEAYFEKGKRHGSYTSWWDNGNKQEEGIYENGERVPGWIKFVPLLAAGIIVVGNIFSSLSIWGFDYHVLHLPYRSTLQLWSNLIVIALAIFPLVSTKEGWHHYAYIVLAIFALALLSRNLSFNIYVLLFLGSEGVRDETGSIFFARTSQRITYTILIVYLLWSLSLASVVRREIGLIFIALAMSAVVSGNYMVDIAKRR